MFVFIVASKNLVIHDHVVFKVREVMFPGWKGENHSHHLVVVDGVSQERTPSHDPFSHGHVYTSQTPR